MQFCQVITVINPQLLNLLGEPYATYMLNVGNSGGRMPNQAIFTFSGAFFNIATTHLIKLCYFSQPSLKTGKRMKIQARLLLIMLATTTFTMATALLVTSYLTREALETAAKDKLAVVLEARESALRHWADEQKGDLTIMAFAPGTIMFLRDLSTEFYKLGDNAQTLLQQNYLASERDYKSASAQPAIAAYDKAYRLATPFFSRHFILTVGGT